MPARSRLLLPFFLIVALSGVAISQPRLAHHARVDCFAAQTRSPCVDKVDPPDWWATFPSPMLLLHGRHLADAKVAVRGRGVSVTRSQASANGHYLFIWLDTANAAPQKITLELSNSSGLTSAPFALDRPKAASDDFQGFSARDIMYLIMPDRFADGDLKNDHPAGAEPVNRALPRGWHGGDLKGIEDHLNYLENLGVTTVWVTPLYDNTGSPQSYHGYGATNMYAVDPHFGTVADYERLVEMLHARGMKLVLDTVPNHVGPGNPWVRDEPTPDWFHGTEAKHLVMSENLAVLTNPHSSPRERIPVLDGWFANILPDLNQSNPLVETYLIQNAVWWIETGGVDGLRLDTFPYVNRRFWHDFHAELHSLFPRLTTVGEVFNADPTVVSFFAGGVARSSGPGQPPIDTGLYTPFDYPMYFKLRAVLIHGESMKKLTNILRQDWLYPHPERLVIFEGNHDTERFLSEPGATPRELKLAFGLLATLRGMPQIYYGDEIGMKGGNDPDNRRDFPGGFPGDKHDAFTARGRSPEENEIHDYVARLFHFRETHPALMGGPQQQIFVSNTALAFARTAGSERLLVVINNSKKPQTLRLNLRGTVLAGARKIQGIWNSNTRLAVNDGMAQIAVPPQSLVVYRPAAD